MKASTIFCSAASVESLFVVAHVIVTFSPPLADWEA